MHGRSRFLRNEIYYIENKSITDYEIFRNPAHYDRFLRSLKYYNNPRNKKSFSQFNEEKKRDRFTDLSLLRPTRSIVHIIGYCVLPDRYMLLAKILIAKSVSQYIENVENSYARYYNTSRPRKGPLWESRFHSTRLVSHEELLDKSSHIHLSPVQNGLVQKPHEWQYSSYNHFVENPMVLKKWIPFIALTPL